jgi:hypothetical protein
MSDEHTHLRWFEQLIKQKFSECANANQETGFLLEMGNISSKLRLHCGCVTVASSLGARLPLLFANKSDNPRLSCYNLKLY